MFEASSSTSVFMRGITSKLFRDGIMRYNFVLVVTVCAEIYTGHAIDVISLTRLLLLPMGS